MKNKVERILVAEDNEAIGEPLCIFLQNQGYIVDYAKNGKSALQKAEAECPDLILLDIMMPGKNGYETCQELKKSERTKDIPVIFLTALTETKDVCKGFEVGGVDYITKPIKYDEVRARVQAHLTIREQQIELELQNAELKRQKEQIQEQARVIEELSRIDLLTDLPNQRDFLEKANIEVGISIVADRPLSLFMADIDNFDQLNETYGHDVGDNILQDLAKKLRAAIRDYDIFGRYGGEEFAVAFPETQIEDAAEIAEKLRTAVDESALEIEGKTIRYTVSIGVVFISKDDSIETLIRRAEKALKKAKNGGRNRVETQM